MLSATDISDSVLDALSVLFRTVFLCFVFMIAKSSAHKHETRRPNWEAYAIAIGVVAIVAVVCMYFYGTHVETESPADIFGDEIVDFVPTGKERAKYGLRTFIVNLAPALLGVFVGLPQRNAKTQMRDA